jgi:hypothetical protein
MLYDVNIGTRNYGGYVKNGEDVRAAKKIDATFSFRGFSKKKGLKIN